MIHILIAMAFDNKSHMRYCVRMNWKKLIHELCSAGMTQIEISTEVGLAQASISDIARGRTKAPSWEPGQKLIALHSRVIKNKSNQTVESQEAA